MSAGIISLDGKEAYSDFHNLDQFMRMQDGYENIHYLPCEICDGFIYLMKFKPGLILTIIKHHSIKPFAVHYQDPANRFIMSFSIPEVSKNGSSSLAETKLPQSYKNTALKAQVAYSPECSGVAEFHPSTNFYTIAILLEPWLMKQLCEDCHDQIAEDLKFILGFSFTSHQYQKSLQITPLINLRLHEILNCRLNGSSKQYFLESKALDLLFLGFEQLKCNKSKNKETSPFYFDTAGDIVIQTRDILLNNMRNPPSLTELSSRVGVNKTTLSQNFRKTYGVSIFEYLRIHRLETAKNLLTDGSLSITEIALEVGYTHHSSFTREFKKYFSLNPSSYLK